MLDNTLTTGQSPLLQKLTRTAGFVRDGLVAIALGWIGVSVVSHEARTPANTPPQPTAETCAAEPQSAHRDHRASADHCR
jgi:hypothetical protein